MKHHWSIGAGSDEEKLHIFVVDYCFPSQGSQQGITVLVIKETKTKAITAFMVPNKGANEYLAKAVVDFMKVRLRSRLSQKSDGELVIVDLREAGKISRESDTILELSPKGDS